MSKTRKTMQKKVADLLRLSARLVNSPLGEREIDGSLDMASILMDELDTLLQPNPGELTSRVPYGMVELRDTAFAAIKAAAAYVGRGEYFEDDAEEGEG